MSSARYFYALNTYGYTSFKLNIFAAVNKFFLPVAIHLFVIVSLKITFKRTTVVK
jgi:hypothetical protein